MDYEMGLLSCVECNGGVASILCGIISCDFKILTEVNMNVTGIVVNKVLSRVEVVGNWNVERGEGGWGMGKG